MKKKTYKDIKSFVVDRKNWIRGKGSVESKLLTEDGKLCCLGFYGIACGLRKQDLKMYASPQDVCKRGKDWNTLLVDSVMKEDTDECGSLMEINDNEAIDDKTREEFLTEEFKSLGIKVKFVG